MLAFGMSDAFWYIVAAVGAAIMLGLIAAFRRVGRWLLRRMKEAYLGWFAEAIDEHVQPKFAQMRSDLQRHTDEEGEIVRTILNEALQPVKTALDEHAEMTEHLESTLTATQAKLVEHMDHDNMLFERTGEALRAGQRILLEQLQSVDPKPVDPPK